MLEVTFPGGVAVDVAVDGQVVHTDQPQPLGGGTAASPFDVFLASIAACAGFFALRFCQERHLTTEGLGVTLETQRDETNPRIATMRLRVKLPQDFPEKYRDALVRSVDHCSVKRTILEPPEFAIAIASPVGHIS